ncbi:sensor histidine kinase [Fundidesulfovibrio terrae]|uniref:sensor histidine kinase n=1 Tax=Fundidesulfovibrio terrae TaxID=2922866 RepID=UPI001FB02E29|nr:hybrid sensor histidine kinase/response regulator [Fundidesulfovibrio terrae]
MRPKTLLIDDEHDFVRLLATRLEARDFPVLTAFDASQGLGLVESQAPPVVVLDVNLPDRSGLEVLREIKERWPLVQVVMLTGQADVATAVTGMKLGAMDYLVKPVDIDPLVRVLERAGSRRLDQEESLRMIETGKLAALGRLAEGVAHEINNPVNTMMQKAQWAQELLEDFDYSPSDDTLPEVRAELEAIVRQARRCRDIVAKLMSLGGRVDPRAGEFDPRDAVRAVLEGVRERAASLGVRLETRFDADVAQALLPRAEIEQVLRHLADNALDAMASGGGILTVTVRDQEASSVRIEVADMGCGVSPGIEDRLFEPFFSTKDVGQGSGLGLSICHGILKSLGGDVTFVRPDGPGAVFAVTLPIGPSRA